MKKIFTLILSVLLIYSSVWARTPEEAAIIASGFMSQKHTSTTVAQRVQKAKSINVAPSAVSLEYTQATASNENAVYVFNHTDGGFVLVSAADNSREVLGFSDNGYFDKNDIPTNMQFWLQMYANEIAKSKNTTTSAMSAPSHAKSYTVVSPLLDCTWDQAAPYNNDCPVVDGERCVTGCVATAISQIMYAHKYPTRGSGSYSYTSDDGVYAFANFGATTYDWNNMLPYYRNNYNNTQASAVAKLMYHVGVSSNMDYGVNESGAVSQIALANLCTYFRYDKGISILPKDFMNEVDILDSISVDLQAGRPIYVDGRTKSNSGHAFVCDGMRSDGYIHINWGWGGYCNGYFTMSALNPDGQGIGGSSDNSAFTEQVTFYTNIQPDKGGTAKPFATVSNLTLTSNEVISKNADISFRLDHFCNIGLADAKGTLKYYFYDTNDHLIANSDCYQPIDLQPGYYYTNPIYLSQSIPAGLANGDYELEVVYTDNMGVKHPIGVQNRGIVRLPVTVSNNSVTISVPTYSYNIRIKQAESSTMNLTNGLYLWWWTPGGEGQFASTTLEDGWYTATITSTASTINCLGVNSNDWGSFTAQTIDFNNISSDVCLEIGEMDSEQGKYNIHETVCSSVPGEETQYTIRVKKNANSTMDLSNGLYLWWWSDVDGNQFVSTTLQDGWYTATITSVASAINCLGVNSNNWNSFTAQTVDMNNITSDICLEIGGTTLDQGKYDIYAIECPSVPGDENQYTIRVKKNANSTMDLSNGLYLWWWSDVDGNQFVSTTLQDGWYTATIISAANTINCLAVNQDSWGNQQTDDFVDITGDICLEIGEQNALGKYTMYVTECAAVDCYALIVNAGNGGSVSVSPLQDCYEAGTPVTLTANPNDGYEFEAWSDGNTNARRTIVMNKDYNLTATFRIIDIPANHYTLTLTCDEGGLVSKSPDLAYYEENASVTISATANEGYKFVQWSDGNTNAIRVVTMNQNYTLHATFIAQYTLMITSSEGGTVSKNPDYELYDAGTQVTLTAQPNEGFEFVQWSDENTDVQRTIVMDKNYELNATFTRTPTEYDIQNLAVTSSNLNITTRWKSIATRFEIVVTDTTQTVVHAEKIDAYEDNKVYKYKAPKYTTYTITVKPLDAADNQIGIEASKSITLERKYSLNIYTEYGGTVNEEVNGEYTAGTSVEIIATPNNGYRFLEWSDGDKNAKRTLIMDQDYDLMATFKRIPTYTLEVFEGENGLANIPAGSYTYQENEVVQLTPIPNDGYLFDHWVVNGVNDTNETITLTMTQNYSVYPVCVAIPIPTYTLTILPGEFGKANMAVGTYTYNEGEKVTLLPVADADYLFDQWVVNGEAIADSVLVLDMVKDYEVMPTFVPNQVAVENIYDGVTIMVEHRTITVLATQSQDIALYDLVGHLIEQCPHTRVATFTVPSAGLYLVRTANGVKKVHVE